MIPLIKGQRKGNLDYRDNLPVNMLAVADNIEGDQGYLISHPGLKMYTEVSGAARGGYFNERLNAQFRVSGGRLEEVLDNSLVRPLGAINGSDTCSFSESFNTQAVVGGGKFYLYDGASLVNVADENVGVPIDLTWFRGIYVLTDGEFLYHTDINNEYSISPLKYSSSEYATDPIKGVIRTDSNEIIAFNRYSTEYFTFNAAAPTGTSVLQAIQGKSSTIGIVGTHCKCFLDGIVFILGGRKGESPSVHIMNGAQEATVATREVDKLIAKYTEDELSTAYMESRTDERDKLLIIHLPNETLVYNHTVASKYGPDAAWSFLKTGDDEQWRGKFGVFDPRVAKWIYGDKKEARLGSLDYESVNQYGNKQEILFYTPIIKSKQTSISQVELDTIPGYSANEMTVGMSLSYDAVGWGQEKFFTVSKPDDYTTNLIIRRLGYVARSFSLRFRMIGEGRMAFSGLEAKIG